MPRFLLGLGLAALTVSGLWAQPDIDAPLAVTGTLVDERGAPVVNAEVVLRPYPSDYEIDLDLLGYDALPPAVDRAQSGPDGSFSLAAPVPGPYRFEIRTAAPAEMPDAVVPLVYGNLTPLETSRVLQANELPNRHLVATRVLDADDRPIEGALVIARPTRTMSHRHAGRNSDQQTGRRYPRFQPAAGYSASSPAEPIAVDGRGVASVDLVLESGGSLRGAVTGLQPPDLAQVTITAVRQARWQSATPDTVGNFTIEDRTPGTWQVIARRGDSFTARSVERSVTITAAGAEEFVELPFEAGLRLTGQVFAAGKPVAGARVRAERPGHEELRQAQVDQQGHFKLDGLVAGSYRLRISTAFGGAEYRSVEVQTDVEGLRIDLQPEAILSGIVVDATTGLPLRNADLVAGDAASVRTLVDALARGEDESVHVSGVIAGGVFSQTGGRFDLRLGPGAELLWVSHDGYENTLVPLNIGPGQHQEGLVIQLLPVPSEPEVP
jgi:hypothetical protein